VTLRLTIGPFHVAAPQPAPAPDRGRPTVAPRAAVVRPETAFAPFAARPPLLLRVPVSGPALGISAGAPPAARVPAAAPRTGPPPRPPAQWEPARMWVVVRDRLMAAAPTLTPRPTATVAVAAAAALRMRKLLVEQHTRREVFTLAGAVPEYQRPPAPEPAAARPARRRAGAEEWPEAEHTAAGRPGAPAAGAPPLDVERLTDQVVRRIDERILAFRERMGKVF
jgi:hypothetical protein